eukprot:TCALIF_01180-PA protein Name:"Similar to POLL DNA polymerase lambda (Homo sapiens)" AED:0.21 eAED:0.21 QI:0/0/0/0.75/0.33/0.25/4/0/439
MTKRRKAGGFFDDLSIHLYPAALSKIRQGIFERQIPQNGGQLVSSLPKSGQILVLIEDNAIEPARLQQIVRDLSQKHPNPEATYLGMSWLSKCLETGQQCLFDEFELKVSEPKPSESNLGKMTKKDEHPKESYVDRNRHKFVCAQSSSDEATSTHPNKLITDELEKLAGAYKNSNDQWRAFGYQKAITSIKNYPKAITNRDEAAALPNVGKKMADKIIEIIEQGSLQKVSEVCNNERMQVLALFNRVWGAGPKTAEQWFLKGHRTLEDLQNDDKLTAHQKVGLRLFHDLDERMQREECTEIYAHVQATALEINPNLEVVACGSYRRGKPTCGDLDILITHPKLDDDLEISSIFNGLLNRLLEERATALMYFTGSAHFNRSMRLLAIKMGMSLSEHALVTDVVRVNKEKANTGTVIPTPTEASVFEALQLPYRAPNERNH